MTRWGHEFFRQATELFQTTKQNISKHIQAIYDDQELNDKTTVNQQLKFKKKVSEKSHAKTIAALEKQAKKESRKK